MGDSTSRLFAVLGLIIAVWVIVFWVYEPSSRRRIILDDRPPQDAPAPAPNLPEPPSLPQAQPARQPTRQLVQPPESAPPPPAEPVPALPPAPIPGPGEVLLPPEFDDYTVRRGETFRDIARARYSDPARWVAIAHANPLLPPDKLKPGVTVLRLPRDPDNIRGKVIKVAPLPGAPLSTPPHTPASEAARPALAADAWRTYTVQENDTLWGIAKKLYNRPSLSSLIAEANTDVLPDPDRLKAGITLKIPPAPPAD